ncbi:MAG: response regulator [Asticcacaulis sp.]|nr:response regulator [Asticcacaulis sp.]
MKKILLAEDEDSVRSFLSRALQRAGFEVVSCADGDSAILALDDGPYDLLLTDIVMPRCLMPPSVLHANAFALR